MLPRELRKVQWLERPLVAKLSVYDRNPQEYYVYLGRRDQSASSSVYG